MTRCLTPRTEALTLEQLGGMGDPSLTLVPNEQSVSREKLAIELTASGALSNFGAPQLAQT